MTRSVLFAFVLLFAALSAGVAHADARVVVRPFFGPNAENVRRTIEGILDRRANVEVVSSKEADVAAQRLDTNANAPEGRKAVARELQISAWVEGIVQKRGKQYRLTVLVYDGENHERVGRTVVVQRNPSALLAELRRSFWQKTKTAILRAAPGEAVSTSDDDEERVARVDEDTDAEEQTFARGESERNEQKLAAAAPARKDKDAQVRSTSTNTTFLPAFTPTLEAQAAHNDAVEPEDKRERRGDTLRASIGIGSPYRSLAYNQIISRELGNYQLSGAPMVDVRMAYHPGSHFTDGWLSYLGLDLRAQMALGIRSVDSAGNEFKSSYDAIHAGILARVPVGDHFVRAFGGYGMQRFSLESQSGNVRSPTPNVDYRMLRGGLGADFALTHALMLGVEGAWLQLLSIGEIGEWFPRTSAGGVEVGLDATYAITERFYARAFAAYQRMFFDFNAQPTDQLIAGGATDQYVTFGLGAGVQL